MSIMRFFIKKMRTVPQNVSWNQISGGFEFYIVNSNVLMNISVAKIKPSCSGL